MARLSIHTLSSKAKLLTALGIILFTSFVGVSFLNYTIAREAIREEIITSDLPLTRDNIYSEVSLQFMRPIMVASSMAADTFLKDWALEGEEDISRITRYLTQIHINYDYFSTFFVSNDTGRYYHFSGLNKVISPDDDHDIWYYDFIRSGASHNLEVDTDEARNNVLTVFINFRVEDTDGRLLGVTGVGLEVNSVARVIREYQDKYRRDIYLVDEDGLIQLHQNPDYIGTMNIRDLPEMAPLADTILASRNEPSNYSFSRNGTDILLTVRYIPDVNWFVFVEQDQDSAMAIARMNFLRTILAGLAASVFIFGLTFATINRYHNKVESLTYSDELTGAANRRGLEDAFTKAEYALGRYNRPLSLILLDLDQFKQVNDQLGHLVGDKVLVAIAKVIQTAIRPSDIFGRWGGDEFVILTESNPKEAEAMADRIRNMIKNLDLAGEGGPDNDPRRNITVCCGVTGYIEQDDLDTMINRADKALYSCKSEGGNIVRLSS